ncbi:NPCBM/NEW2 domain-containing protein, partial [Bacteroidales bacterium OttesenSCG-928-J19]|nr:NPCBM/NEW2 domain-containing protein [Bacteroidales bacterium OttesenSCG-928-J19]
DNYTILKAKEGAQEYYNSIFELYASWGVDFIKIDDLSRPYHQDEIEMIRTAIDNTGRPIVLSVSPGETPVANAEHVKTHTNMWRTVDDFWDNWDHLLYQFTVCNKWYQHSSYGAWADADMLPLGHIGIRAERGADRMTGFTRDEQFTLMSLWSIFKSPLMFGGHLPDNDALTDSLITNPEVLYVNQHSVNNRQHSNDGEVAIWTADDPENGDKFVALFNLGDNGFIDAKNVLYRSGIISNLTDGHGINIDQELPEGTKSLFLIVTDGGDNFDGDHADWINPVFYNDKGDEIKLTDLTWEWATAGWGNVTKNKSVGGGNLTIDGKTYTNGIGTHSNSVIQFAVPEGYTKFKAFAGIDYSGMSQEAYNSTVEFMLFTEDPTLRDVNTKTALFNSGRMSRTFQQTGRDVDVDITGATKLYLVVTDAGDGIDYDHGDWVNPTLHKADGNTLDLTTVNWVRATSGWDQVKKNKSLDNRTLTINGQTYAKGFGTNSNSIIEFDLPEGYTRFTAFCGFDDEVKNASKGVTIEFLVYTTDPKALSNETLTLDLEDFGFNGSCQIRDLWERKDLGVFSGSEFRQVINRHGVGFYRISSEDRNKQATVSLTPSISIPQKGEVVLFEVEVASTDEAIPTGSVLIFRDGVVVGTLALKDGKAVFTEKTLLEKGSYTYTAQYSGNTIYRPKTSNTVNLEVREGVGISETGSPSNLKIISENHTNYLVGVAPQDEVMVYNASGQVLAQFYAANDKVALPNKQFTIIRVKSGTDYTVLKSLAK